MLRNKIYTLCSLILAIPLLGGCLFNGKIHDRYIHTSEEFRYLVDPTIASMETDLPGIQGGPSRSTGVVIGPDGQSNEFVANEVIFHPRNAEELNAFLDKYQGVILLDGTPLLLPEIASENPTPESSGWYLIRIDPQSSSLDDLIMNVERIGSGGLHIFSSEEAVRLVALVTREKLLGRFHVSVNLYTRFNAVEEHPDSMGGFLDAETWPWMTDDDDPSMPGDQGLSTSVIRAWRYLAYKGIPPTGTWSPPLIAIIDRGFDLDASGNPVSAAKDFFPSKPLQIDMVDHDFTAGGINPDSSLPWHGQEVFGVAASRHANRFGGAGTSGNFAWPLLIRNDGTFYTKAEGIRAAVLNGADVINLSTGFSCATWNWFCSVWPDDAYAHYESAVLFATSSRVIVVASAGNNGIDLGTDDMLPCETSTVICVGAIDQNAQNVGNYGASVDIWAPTNIYSTVIPTRENQIGTSAICCLGGTSASAPFVTGVIALMKALDPSITSAQIVSILKDTANISSDDKVEGYIDALRAVQAVSPNLPPTAAITIPLDEAMVSHTREVFFHADVIDPEVGADFRGEVTFSSNKDGELCRTSGFATGCTGPALSLGTHQITMMAVDPFDAIATDIIMVHSINQSPTAKITYPANNVVFSEEQTINLRGYGHDWDGLIDETNITWESNIDGSLGFGRDILVSLSPGTHTITLTATDDMGLFGQDTIILNIHGASGLPTALIVSPENGVNVAAETPITLEGQATDPEDGVLLGQSLVWESDIDGVLGSGATLTTTLTGDACGVDSHTITLHVSDSDGNEASHSIEVFIGTIC